MVDELVEYSRYDKELADGLRYLDGQAWKKKISFYAMVFEVMYSVGNFHVSGNLLDKKNGLGHSPFKN